MKHMLLDLLRLTIILGLLLPVGNIAAVGQTASQAGYLQPAGNEDANCGMAPDDVYFISLPAIAVAKSEFVVRLPQEAELLGGWGADNGLL